MRDRDSPNCMRRNHVWDRQHDHSERLKIEAMAPAATLTAKQAKFAAGYPVNGNGTRAAVAAGYGRAGARTTASRTLANAHVLKALQARQSADATAPFPIPPLAG